MLENHYEHEREETRKWQNVDARSKPYCRVLPPKRNAYWRDCADYLINRGLSPRIAKANLWYPTIDDNGDVRLVMPATSAVYDNHFWQSRLVSGSSLKRYDSPAGCTSGDAVIAVYPLKSDETRWDESAIVEGPMCALAVAMTGRLGIALMGADPPDEKLDLTMTLARGTIVTIIPDADRPDALIRVMSKLNNRGVQCTLKLPLPPAKDLADMPPGTRSRLFR